MSKYTTQVRWIVEHSTPGFDGTITNRIKAACPKIFDFDFPIWNEEYRIELEAKIIRHYYMEEIGGETVGLWKLWLEDKLNAIMPYYNKLYETTVKDYDYMVDVDTTEDLQRTESRTEDVIFKSNQEMDSDTTDDTTISQTVNTNGNTDTHSDSKTTGNPTSHSSHNDFPQAPLEQNKGYGTYEDYIQNVLSENVLVDNTETVDNLQTTNGADNRKVTTNQETTANSTNNLTEDRGMEHTIHKRGLNGARSFTDLLMQYRNSLINIDMMIIKELSDLFMQVY